MTYKGLAIVGFYHSPTSAKNHDLDCNFYDDLCEIHESNLILIGDANVNSAASFRDSESSTPLKAFMQNVGLHQMVQDPTHEKGNTLDVVLCSDPKLVKGKPEIIPTNISDHHAIITEFNIPTEDMEVPITITRPSLLNYSDIEDEIAFQLSVLPDTITDDDTADEYCDHFHDAISSVISRHLEKTKITVISKPNEPYITKDILDLRKANKRLLAKARSNNTPSIWKTYNDHYDYLCRQVKKAQAKYEMTLVGQIRNQPHKFYNYANGKTRSCAPIGPLEHEAGQAESDQDMAEVLVKHYESAHSERVDYKGNFASPLGVPVMPEVRITERKVRKALFRLKPNKAPGNDKITISQLRKLQRTVVPYLTKLIRYSYETGFFYTHWRTVLINPLHKPGKPREKASSYRPIALLMVSLKLAESCIMHEWILHMEKFKLMSASQHSGRPGMSTITNMTEYLDFVTKAVDEGHKVSSLVFDLSLAFDKSVFKDLVQGALDHGMAPKAARWLNAFLTKRQISVKVGKAISSSYSPESSTSQGSIASVAFFNCVMDDLKKTLPASVKCFQFCDDTKLVCITDTKEQRDLLASAVRKFCRWSKRKHLKVNAGKSYALHFNRAEPRRYYFDGVEIPTVRDGLDLGIVVDDGLTWRPHWESAIAQLQQKSQQVRRNYTSRNPRLMTLLWEIFCSSSIQYSCPIIPLISVAQKRQIMRIQRNFFRNVIFDERTNGPPPLLHKMEALRLSYTWKILHNKLNVAPSSLFTTLPRDHRLGPLRLVAPKCRTRVRREFYALNVVAAWNKLPAVKRTIPSVSGFKSYLKKKHHTTRLNEHLPSTKRFRYENVAAA